MVQLCQKLDAYRPGWQPLNLSEWTLTRFRSDCCSVSSGRPDSQISDALDRLVADSSIKKNYRKAILMVSELSLLFCFCWFSAHLFGAHSPQHAAMAKAHPDRHQSASFAESARFLTFFCRGLFQASSEQQVRADRIFNAGCPAIPTW